MAAVNVRDGKSCFLWQDMWLSHIPKLNFPELYSFAINPHITLYDALSASGPPDLFHLPISDTALQQLIVLAENLNSLTDSDDLDLWSYIWGSPFFSSAKAYKHLTGHAHVHKPFNWLWKSCCQNKHKVFFWLLLKDRNILRRKTMFLDSYDCVMCSTKAMKNDIPLILPLQFAQICWNLLNLQVPGQTSIPNIVDSFKQALH